MAEDPASVFRRMKLLCLVDRLGRDTLTFILRQDTSAPTAPPGIRLDDYLRQRTPDNSSCNYLTLSGKAKKNSFDGSQMKQIEMYLLWDEFDVTLLYKAIRLACERVASLDSDKWNDVTEMEGLIKTIKEKRNALAHETGLMTERDFHVQVQHFEKSVLNLLDATKPRFGVPDDIITPVKDKVLHDTIKIKSMEKQIAAQHWRTVRPEFIKESRSHLKRNYELEQYIQPLSFLTGFPDDKVHVQSIYCELFLKEEQRSIDAGDIFTLPESAAATRGNQPVLIMIEGKAGSGKTTLLTHFISEWLKDAKDCKIKHLSEFDIVLRILCRDKDGPSLQEYLTRSLPDCFALIPEYLVTLLSDCKVLFLVDGLDELSRGSDTDNLIEDILKHSQNQGKFTIICTSRPETANNFWKGMRSNTYQRWRLEIEGVKPENRMDFVLKSYDSLPSTTNKDRDGLRKKMATVKYQQMFELPLNLLFVATLFYLEPDRVKTTTQTSLYLTIHEWCVEKLDARLAQRPDVERDELVRKNSIKRVLEVLYDVALQGLLHDRLNLSEEDARCLVDSCQKEKLPHTEILAAFLCLHVTVVSLVRQGKYSAPHKSLQEFYGAKHIINQLVKDSPAGSIRDLLHLPSTPVPATSSSTNELIKHQNLLKLVVGILCETHPPPPPTAMQEAVDLLAQTGMMTKDWLSMLEDTEVNDTVLECVVQTIQRRDQEEMLQDTVDVTDSNTTSATALLPCIPHKKINIRPETREPELKLLCCLQHTYTGLFLYKHYQTPESAVSDAFLDAVARSDIQVFMGHLTPGGLMHLRECRHLRLLWLAVRKDEDIGSTIAAIRDVCPSLPCLQNLNLHIPVAGDIVTTNLPELPDVTFSRGRGVSLVLSGVDETLLDSSCRIAAALQPSNNGYLSIQFTDLSSVDAGVLRKLLDSLCNAGVRVRRRVAVPDTCPITEEEERELYSHAKTRMLGAFVRRPNYMLW